MDITTNLTRRAFLGSAAVAGLALAGCGGSGEQDASDGTSGGTAGDPTKVSFVLDYSPNVNHTGIYVAIQKG